MDDRNAARDRDSHSGRSPLEIPHTSFLPAVTHVPAPSSRRRRRTQNLPILPILAAVVLVPALVAAILVALRLPRLRPPGASLQLPRVVVTATPNNVLAQTATSVLPPEYILALSQTPPALAEVTADPAAAFLAPTVTPAFVPATPSFLAANAGIGQIVYVCFVNGSDEICLMNADGSEQRQLTSTAGTDWYPSISPDGQLIVFSSQRGNGPFDIYAVSALGGEARRLTRNLGDNYAPEISPDGTRIVFTSTYGPQGDQNIWVMNSDGSNPVRLTDSAADDIDPTWSPDGQQISFASNRSGTKELFIMNADGTGIRQLTSGVGIGGRNDWSSDGRWLTFYAGPGSDKDIFIIPIECAQIAGGCDRSLIRQLTDGGSNKGPSFSPDNQWITFASSRDGDNEIMIMRIDGSSATALTANTIADWQPRWGP